MVMRKLNDEGVRRFAEHLDDGAPGEAPLSLLQNPETSETLFPPLVIADHAFENRYEFGVWLNRRLELFDATMISGDRNLWTSLALRWFDQICPKRVDGTRDVKEPYRYILSTDYRHYYRHLVRSPWQLVRLHGENARFLLVSPRENDHPLSVHGEILEQFGGRQQVLGSRPIVAAASRLYLNPETGRPRKGVAGSGRGSARRFGLVLRQLDLTYDPEVMPDDGLIRILPAEFSAWRRHLQEHAAAEVSNVAEGAPATP
jgi:hypothetical protein